MYIKILQKISSTGCFSKIVTPEMQKISYKSFTYFCITDFLALFRYGIAHFWGLAALIYWVWVISEGHFSYSQHEDSTHCRTHEWSSRSPDLNPCDYFLWWYIGRELTKLGWPNSKDALIAKVYDIVDDIPQSMINSVIDNFNKRVRACVQAEGGIFENHLKNIDK